MTSSDREVRDAIIDAISDSKELRAELDSIPPRVAETVRSYVPVDTGTAKASIEIQHRRTPWRRLSTRRIRIGTVDSTDDIAKIQAIEYGRHNGEHGTSPEFAPFRRAAAYWDSKDNGF